MDIINEKDFNSIIADIKKETFDPETTKKYISLIATRMRNAYKNCSDELTPEEFIAIFLQEYNNELNFTGSANELYRDVLKNRGYRDFLKLYKNDRGKFNSIIRIARQREEKNNQERLNVDINREENMISILRNLFRCSYTDVEKVIIPFMQRSKEMSESDIKQRMIKIIQESVAFLNDYGILDEYISDANAQLAELGLERLSYKKRNPIPDEKYNAEGKKIENNEDIGVIDAVDTDVLMQHPIDVLIIETAFWESKYWQNRIEISRAKGVMDSLGIWNDTLLNGNIAIADINDEKLEDALKKDEAITELHRRGIEVSPKLSEQYDRFVTQKCVNSEGLNLKQAYEKMNGEITNLAVTGYDIATLQCLIISQLLQKNPRVKRWGKIPNDEMENINVDGDNLISVAVDHQDFRGTIILASSKKTLQDVFHADNIDFPDYKKIDSIDEKYNDILTKICILNSEYFKRVIKEEYKNNPNNQLLAFLNGKPVKKVPEQPGGDAR